MSDSSERDGMLPSNSMVRPTIRSDSVSLPSLPTTEVTDALKNLTLMSP